jgi:hypothetical protein
MEQLLPLHKIKPEAHRLMLKLVSSLGTSFHAQGSRTEPYFGPSITVKVHKDPLLIDLLIRFQYDL